MASQPPTPPGAAPSPVRLGAYELGSVLGRGSSAVVHQGRHATTGARVAVKQIFLTDPAGLESLRREIAILGRLRHPGIVRMVAHGIHDGSPWYAMEIVDGRSLEALWAERSPDAMLGESLRILRDLCPTLAFLHGEGLVHRDLKPANVVIRADGTPVLVDFGLVGAFAARTGREILERGGDLRGSFDYIAPEQLRGEFVDARADLYAFGCMLYQALTGTPPFVGPVAVVAQAHLDRTPAPPSAPHRRLSPALGALVMELLAKAPRERPGYASDVARRLDAVLGGAATAAPSPATYLYRASFVGRQAPLRELERCLDQVRAGEAACVLVAGESGVGKTRLAMEATRLAAVRRFAVVTGECLPAGMGGGSPLHPFVPALQRLADVCRQRGPVFTAAILAGRTGVMSVVAPELMRLPGVEDDPAPAALPATAARERLVRTLVDLLTAWARDEPLAVVLDDLQWADDLTLAALETLAGDAAASPLFVLGLLRSDAGVPRLQALVAGGRARWIALARLDDEALDALVSDMLAMPRAPRALVEFLAAQSEGNPFFVSEYLRTAVGAGLLVREGPGAWRMRAGDGAYAELGLPRTLRELVERRLHDLDEPPRRLLAAAAVLGRDFDPALAAALVELDGATQMDALAALRARQVADVGSAGLWRFAHDKLREVAYDVTPPEHRRALHAAAAAALEVRIADDARASDHFGTIAHHLAAAGETRRAGEYFGRAGEHALAAGDLDAAGRQLREAIANVPAQGALDHRRAHWLRLLAETNAGTDLSTAIAQTGEALALLGQRIPRRALGWLALIGAELWRGAAIRSGFDRAVAIEAAQASSRAANSFYFRFDILRGVASSLRCVNLAEAAGEPGRAALPYAQLGYVAGGLRLHRIAARCFANAEALRHATAADPSDFAAGLYFHAMYAMGLGHWTRSEALAREAVTALEGIGNHQEREVAATVLANTLHFAGKLSDAEASCVAVEASAQRRGHVQHRAWGTFLRGRARLAFGDVPAAREAVELGYQLLLPTRDFVSLVMCEGLLARVRWCSGDVRGAAQAADAFEQRLAERRLVPLAQCLGGYWSFADVRLRLWHDERSSRHAAAASARACTVLRRFARLFPIARPAALRAHARHHAVLGNRRRARHAWSRSIELSRRFGMPYDEAGALLDLGAFDDDPLRRRRAVDILRGLGCAPTAATLERFDT